MSESEQMLHITAKGAELGIDVIQRILNLALDGLAKGNLQPILPKETKIQGLQSLSDLNKQQQELVPIPVDEPELNKLSPKLQSYGVDFAVDKSGDSYNLFFKAKDSAQIEYAFKQVLEEISQQQTAENPSQAKSAEKVIRLDTAHSSPECGPHLAYINVTDDTKNIFPSESVEWIDNERNYDNPGYLTGILRHVARPNFEN